jgi:gas vesicle protein
MMEQGVKGMDNRIEKRANDLKNAKNIMLSLLIGGAAGATAMLLLAPQLGKQTRARIQQSGNRLRNITAGLGRDALAQLQYDGREIRAGMREKAGQLKQMGKDQIITQLDHMSVALDAGKTAVKAA